MDAQATKQIYAKLIAAISNESGSPELLEYEESTVNNMISQIQNIEKRIKSDKSQIDLFCIEQHRLEKDRLQYAVNSYLRKRIQKIELNCTSLIKMFENDSHRTKKLMSIGEIKYLDRYFMNMEKYLGESILGKLNIPIEDTAHTFSLLELPRNESELFNTSYVFVKALRQVEVIVDSDDGEHESIRLEPNSIHFLPYSSVRHHMLSRSGDVILM